MKLGNKILKERYEVIIFLYVAFGGERQESEPQTRAVLLTFFVFHSLWRDATYTKYYKCLLQEKVASQYDRKYAIGRTTGRGQKKSQCSTEISGQELHVAQSNGFMTAPRFLREWRQLKAFQAEVTMSKYSNEFQQTNESGVAGS